MTTSSARAPFPSSTAWSTVLGAQDRNAPDRNLRLESLVKRYWKPVCWYLLKRWSCPPEDAADLTQEFFLRLAEGDALRGASPERGRFRTFLKLQLHDLVVDDLRRRRAQKRGGGAAPLPLDAVLQLEWPGQSPEEQFDRVWAADLLSGTLQDLKESLASEGKAAVFQAYWNCSVADPRMSYEECAAALGVTVEVVRHSVFNSRQAIRPMLLARVRESVEREEDAEEELAYLLKLLRS
jgi:RNA polymerase sigma factor (sigma-70 family)